MKKVIGSFLLKMSAALVVMLYIGTGNAALISAYEFSGNFEDELNNNAELIGQGGMIINGQYKFGNDQGLILNRLASDADTYAIEMKIVFSSKGDANSRYNKLFGFGDENNNLVAGLYLYQNDGDDNTVLFYPEDTERGVWVEGEAFVVGLAVSTNTIDLFLNGTNIYSIVASESDENKANVSVAQNTGNPLNFFISNRGFERESFEGAVDWIRIHDDASTFSIMHTVSEPPMLGMLVIVGMFACARRYGYR